jgi:hypothetical protein
VHVGVDAGGVPQVESRVVWIDGPHEVEVGIGGDGAADGAAHAATGTEDAHTLAHVPAP